MSVFREKLEATRDERMLARYVANGRPVIQAEVFKGMERLVLPDKGQTERDVRMYREVGQLCCCACPLLLLGYCTGLEQRTVFYDDRDDMGTELSAWLQLKGAERPEQGEVTVAMNGHFQVTEEWSPLPLESNCLTVNQTKS